MDAIGNIVVKQVKRIVVNIRFMYFGGAKNCEQRR